MVVRRNGHIVAAVWGFPLPVEYDSSKARRYRRGSDSLMSEAVEQVSTGRGSGATVAVPKTSGKNLEMPAKPTEISKTPLIDRAERGGNIGRLLLVGLLLLGLVGLFTILPEAMAKS